MASIALSVIGCIDYLAYGGIFTRAVFPFVAKEAKNEFFDSRKKAQDVRREEVPDPDLDQKRGHVNNLGLLNLDYCKGFC